MEPFHISDSKLLTPEEVIFGDLAIRGNWVVGNVAGEIAWPVRTQEAKFQGLKVFIIPVMEGYCPAIAIRLRTNEDPLDGQRTLLEFASSLSWALDKPINIESFGGGNLPRPFGRRHPYPVLSNTPLDTSYLPEPTHPDAKLALALYREAMVLAHPAYSFLTYFKILEVAFPAAKARSDWLQQSLPQLTDVQAKAVIAELGKNTPDIAEHLYVSGRCAIAHAGRQPIVNPDNPIDLRRLYREVPLIRALSAFAIESVLHVKSGMTVYREHLYELAGFHALLGDEFINRCLSGDVFEAEVDFPLMSVQIGNHRYESLARMLPSLAFAGSTFLLQLRSTPPAITFQCELNFREQQLHFDVHRDIDMSDDGSASSAAAIAEAFRFIRDYYANGELRILNAETGQELSRKEPFIPLNHMLDVDAMDATIDHWKNLVAERSVATALR